MKDCQTHVNETFVVNEPKYLSRCSTHAMNEVIKSLNDEQREAVVRMGFRSMLELRTCSLPYDIFSWMTDQYNIKRGCFRLHGKDVQLTAEDVHCILGLPISGTDIESLLVRGWGRGTHIDVVGCSFSVILRNSYSLIGASMLLISWRMDKVEECRRSGQRIRMHSDSHLLVRKYLHTRTEELLRIVDWSQAAIKKRVRKLRELRLFSEIDVDMVDALKPRKDVAEFEALRSRLDSFGTNVIEVKSELKSLRESVDEIGRNVELSQSKMMEELHRFMTFINEKYIECGDI
ncbi:hypothetical protein M9H77_27416 [Catharanthus roseus]|uniref:Uncharacterized protein n=1 Tax=Catharanthus roseus TaxID=4058 RepID=A0ACC0AF65_CATRO|nr:hypothetical protein M9H77_27416 [Catharanthus roseus]